MSLLEDLLARGLTVQQAVGDAREALKEWNEAVETARTVMSETDQAKLDQRLEAVHAESMQMSQELDGELRRQRRG